MPNSGRDTSEFKVATSAGVWGSIATVLGVIIAVGAQVVEKVGETSIAGIVVGAVVAVAGIVMKTLSSLKYIQSRTEVKKNGGKQ